jgi:hypothetical protein
MDRVARYERRVFVHVSGSAVTQQSTLSEVLNYT